MTDQTPDWIRDMEAAGGASFALDESTEPAEPAPEQDLESSDAPTRATFRNALLDVLLLTVALAALATAPALVIATYRTLL